MPGEAAPDRSLLPPPVAGAEEEAGAGAAEVVGASGVLGAW